MIALRRQRFWIFGVVAAALPQLLAAAAGAKEVAYVTHPNTGTISVIDTHDAALTAAIRTGDAVRPAALAMTPDGHFVYVTNYLSGTVSVVDTATHLIVETIGVGNGPSSAAITADGQFVLVSNDGSCSVSVISTALRRVVNTIPVGYYPIKVVVTPDGASAYAATEDTLAMIDVAQGTVVRTVRLANPRLAISPNGAALYAWRSDSDTLVAFDAKNRF